MQLPQDWMLDLDSPDLCVRWCECVVCQVENIAETDYRMSHVPPTDYAASRFAASTADTAAPLSKNSAPEQTIRRHISNSFGT
ncbi:unnamed protein product [Penicillium bialowiezense]